MLYNKVLNNNKKMNNIKLQNNWYKNTNNININSIKT